MPKIVITGASGFVGGSVWKDLQHSGWQTVGVGRRMLKHQENYLLQDLSQPFSSQLIHEIQSADVVLHAAARSSPWGSQRQFERDNVAATARLLEVCSQHGSPRLIFISSSSVYYQPQDQLGLTETSPLAPRPINRYAATKQAGEKLVRQYQGDWVILRPRAVYGKGDTVLFPRILTAAKAGRLPMLVRSGTPVVGDLISIGNLVACIRTAATDETIVGDYNLTDNHPVEINSLLTQIFERLEIKAPDRKLSVKTAHHIAHVLELVYGTFMPNREPPITRFGVHVFAYSKTFDVTKMLDTFGPPQTSTDQAIDQFVDWIKQEDPYGL